MRENNETINSLHVMNDCDLFTLDETATAWTECVRDY
jgi:hypothetical protein